MRTPGIVLVIKSPYEPNHKTVSSRIARCPTYRNWRAFTGSHFVVLPFVEKNKTTQTWWLVYTKVKNMDIRSWSVHGQNSITAGVIILLRISYKKFCNTIGVCKIKRNTFIFSVGFWRSHVYAGFYFLRIIYSFTYFTSRVIYTSISLLFFFTFHVWNVSFVSVFTFLLSLLCVLCLLC